LLYRTCEVVGYQTVIKNKSHSMKYRRKEKEMKNLKKGKLGCSEKDKA
jgi:hypothetical protein